MTAQTTSTSTPTGGVRVRLAGTRANCEHLAAALPALLAGVAVIRPLTGFVPDRRTAPRPRPRPGGADGSPLVRARGPLVGLGELAEMAGVKESTLRAYLARGEAGLPEPQVTVGQHRQHRFWAAADAETWATTRRTTPTGRVYLDLRPITSQATDQTATQTPHDQDGSTR
jgi:hypothetical protein